MLQIANEQEVSIPDNLSIVSPISSNIKETSPLHIQLTKNNIKYFNSDRVDENKKWDRRKKPVYVLDGLNEVETEYCMVLDGKDTCFTQSAEDIIDTYLTYNKDIVYNATMYKYGDFGHLSNAKEILGDLGRFCHLNAGICIGKTEVLKQFYKEVVEYIEKTRVNSEEYHIYHLWINKWFDKIGIDNKCKMFQVFDMNVRFSKENPNQIIIK